jgi:hypothetical protein
MIFRILLIAFNVAVVGLLVYRIVATFRESMSASRKMVIRIGGIMLLLAPLGIFFRFFAATPQYFLIYPVAIGLFLYLTKQL